MYKKVIESYIGVLSSIRLYWEYYGGATALITSPYLHTSLIIALVICGSNETTQDWKWFETPLSVLPNVLGFTLGSYAILLSNQNEKFLQILTSVHDTENESLTVFLEFNGTFVHFIMLQIICILFATLCKELRMTNMATSFAGETVYIYALLSSVAAALAILRIAKWSNALHKE